jgi:hypothetical protein
MPLLVRRRAALPDFRESWEFGPLQGHRPSAERVAGHTACRANDGQRCGLISE